MGCARLTDVGFKYLMMQKWDILDFDPPGSSMFVFFKDAKNVELVSETTRTIPATKTFCSLLLLFLKPDSFECHANTSATDAKRVIICINLGEEKLHMQTGCFMSSCQARGVAVFWEIKMLRPK